MDELAKSFAALAEKFGPAVADAAKGAARVEALSFLASSVIWFVIAGVCLYGAHRLYHVIRAAEHAPDYHDRWDETWYMAVVTLFLLGVGCLLPAIWAWIDPWTWTTLNHPELWLAKKAFHL